MTSFDISLISISTCSFTVKNLQGKVVACGMNCDAFLCPKVEPVSKALGYVFEVLEHAKGPVR